MVTVYTTNTCGVCVMLKKYLTMKNVDFNTVDVTDDKETRDMLLEKSGYMTVPVTSNGTDFIAGFNPAQLQKIIA